MSIIFVLLLIFVSILLGAMVAGYGTLSTSHLRHWAKQQDAAAKKLYPLKARGSAVLLTIELLRALFLSAALVLMVTNLSDWFAWLLVAALLFIAFVVLTQLYLKPFGIRLLVWLSEPLLTLTNALKPIMLPLGRVFDRFLEEEPVTLTRQELKRMLDVVAPEDTDLSPNEMRVLNSVLEFSQRTVHDVMIPKSKVVTVPVTETLTPVILDDLYKSGHSHFPVLGDDKKTVVGMLNMHDLMDINNHSVAQEAMQPKAYFVDEDRDLEHVLEVFYKTKQTVFVVHNPASDMVGLITVEDVVQEILGKPISKEAVSHKVHEHKERTTASDEDVAVIE